MTSYFRVYCNTDNKWEYTWSDEYPNECPVNSNHNINENSISKIPIESVISKRFEFNSYKFKKETLSTQYWTKLTTFAYAGKNTVGFLRKIVIVSRMDENNGIKDGDINNNFGFSFRIYDKTNQELIYDTYVDGSSEEELFKFQDMNNNNQSNNDALWQLAIKKDENSGDIYIEGIDLYFYKVQTD